MRKLILLLTPLMLLWAVSAAAQVAVPELAPAAPRLSAFDIPIFTTVSLTPENPAAMQWGSPSRVGAGGIDGKSDPRIPGIPVSEVKGQYGGLRLVFSRVSFGAGVSGVTVKGPTGKHTEDVASLAFAFSAEDILAVGLSGSHVKRDDGLNRDEIDGRTLGFSLRLGEHVFLGAATGKDYVKHQDPGGSGRADRDFTMAGAGLRGGGGLLWHVEYDVVYKGDFRDHSGTSHAPGYNLQQGNIELGFWNLLFGYNAFEARFDGPLGSERLAGYTADVGIAPALGLTVTARQQVNEYKIPGMNPAVERINSAAVSWQF